MSEGVRRWARIGHLAAGWAFLAAVVIQVFLAGLALFANAGGFRTHVEFGYSAVWIVVLLLPAFALLARLPRREVGLSVLLFALYIPQCLLPPIARSGGPGWLAALHPVNAMVLFALGVAIAWRSWEGVRHPEGSRPDAQGT